MTVQLNTLVLNEAEWLRRNWQQHRAWPGMKAWIFVESADAAYQRANPNMVSLAGLSVDGTTELLDQIAKEDNRVTVIHYGLSGHANPELGKIACRNEYWRVSQDVRPEFMITLDADEFYTRDDQARLADVMRFNAKKGWRGFTFPKREIWRPPSIADQPLFTWEVIGGFWGIPCCHWWRWELGAGHFGCHNTPQDAQGRYLNDELIQLHRDAEMPQMFHLGFCASAKTRAAKNRYYEVRGESQDRQRRWYTESRAAWETWKPGDVLPRGAKVVRYDGLVPECFKE